MPITHRFSAMWSDKLGDAIKELSKEPYALEMPPGGSDFHCLEVAINQGIDSHLEAIHFTQGSGEFNKERVVIEPQCLHVLVRRLMEAGEDQPECYDLASCICETLGIELV